MPIVCPVTPPVGAFREFRDRLEKGRIPYGGSIALTYRCNQRCLHCYSSGLVGRGELSTGDWGSLLDQMAEAGCLFLVMTGGEPMLREDFNLLYRRSVEQGMLVTVFSNGTTVDASRIALFRDLPPQEVEITLLGASAEVHDGLAGKRGSFDAMLRGLQDLLESGIRVSLKTVLMKDNLRDLRGMEALAAERGVRFRLDGAVFAGLDGSRDSLALRVDPAAVVRAEMENPARRDEWREFFREYGDVSPGGRLYQCGAGTNGFHLDPSGRLQACVMTPDLWEDAAGSGFRTAWARLADRVAVLSIPDASPCYACRQKALCGYCPGFFRLETGSATESVNFLCELGRLRYDALNAS